MRWLTEARSVDGLREPVELNQGRMRVRRSTRAWRPCPQQHTLADAAAAAAAAVAEAAAGLRPGSGTELHSRHEVDPAEVAPGRRNEVVSGRICRPPAP